MIDLRKNIIAVYRTEEMVRAKINTKDLIGLTGSISVKNDKIKICAYCKHFFQRKTHGVCINSNQKEESIKNYVYYNFHCDLFDFGIHQSRIDYTNSKTP